MKGKHPQPMYVARYVTGKQPRLASSDADDDDTEANFARARTVDNGHSVRGKAGVYSTREVGGAISYPIPPLCCIYHSGTIPEPFRRVAFELYVRH